jgi:hypothetical protein
MFKKASKCHRNSPLVPKGTDLHEKAGAGRQWHPSQEEKYWDSDMKYRRETKN